MAAKKTLVKDKNILPEKKMNVNKEWMFEWLAKYGTVEDVEWYQKICAENITKFLSNLNGQDYEIPDWAKVRAHFLERFFPGSYGKKPAAKVKQLKYAERLDALLAAKRMERDRVAVDDEAPPEPEPASYS